MAHPWTDTEFSSSNESADSERYDLQIAVISDTHNQIPERLPPALAPADEIWHLGDVCRPETLNVLNTLSAVLTVVQGNNDPYFHWEDRLLLERNGLRFQLQHLPPRSVDPTLTALLFGHMHYPIKEHLAGGLSLNPGAITGPRNNSVSSFAWLSISTEGEWTWDIRNF